MMPLTVNEGAASAALWLSVAEIARRQNVTRQTVHEKVKKLVRDGKLELRPGRGNEKLVNVAAFDRAIGETTDLAKLQAAATVRGLPLPEPHAPAGSLAAAQSGEPQQTFTEAQRQKALYDAGLKAIEYAERRGELIPIAGEHGVEQAVRELVSIFVQSVRQMSQHSGECFAQVTAQGERGARAFIKRLERELLEAVTRGLKSMEEKGRSVEAAGGFELDLPEPEIAETDRKTA